MLIAARDNGFRAKEQERIVLDTVGRYWANEIVDWPNQTDLARSEDRRVDPRQGGARRSEPHITRRSRP